MIINKNKNEGIHPALLFRRKRKGFIQHYFFREKSSAGFTLIELLIVIAIIAVVAAVIFVALNPLQRFKDARNTQRQTDVDAIAGAVRIYQIDSGGHYPTGITEDWQMLGTDSAGCNIDCSSGGVGGVLITDDSETDFDNGIYSNTQWDGANSWVELTAIGKTNGSGNFTSGIKDAGASTNWTQLSWTPERPVGKELPNSGQSESGYSTGNANMSGIELLYHMDDSSGNIIDSSGNSKNGTANGSLTYGATGKLNSALNFNGTDAWIEIPGGVPGTYGVNAKYTLMSWVKLDNTAYGKILFDGIYAGWNSVFILSSGLRHTVADTTPTTTLVFYNQYNYSFQPGTWYHVAATYDSENGISKLYINGQMVKQDNGGITTVSSNNKIRSIGRFSNNNSGYFAGDIDETAIYSRILSETEVEDVYLRGANRLKFQVKSCDDNLCSGESFVGPDGTASTYYSEIDNSTTGLPALSIDNLNANQYFQYKTFFETDSSLYSPALKIVSAESSGATSSTFLAESCLDLSTDLSAKIPTIPYDPQVGSAEKTYYAMRKRGTKQIEVTSCGAEGEEINIIR